MPTTQHPLFNLAPGITGFKRTMHQIDLTRDDVDGEFNLGPVENPEN